MPRKEMSEEAKQKARENGKLGGRTPKYATAEALESAIDGYFDNCSKNETLPTWADMVVKLGISDRTLLNYRTNEEYIKSGYFDVIKKAEMMHCNFWQNLAVTKPNLQSFCIFELKQPHNGGFADKQQVETNGKQTIEIKIAGTD